MSRCAACGEVIDHEQDFQEEYGVHEPRRWHFQDRADNPCAPPDEVITKLFTAADPRPWHRAWRGAP